MAYSPAFQFYPKDFLADPNTIRMEPLHIGAYLLLLMECWDRDNRLPKDMEILAEVCRMTVEEFEPVWKKRLARCFREKKTFFWHKRLAEEIEKQKEWKAKHSDSGKKGAEKRWAAEREKNNFSEKTSENSGKNSENSQKKSAEVKPTENNDLQNGTAMASPSVAIASNSSSSSSSSSSSFKPSYGLAQKPKEQPKKWQDEIDTWLNATAPITGAKGLRTMANAKRWRDTIEKAVAEQRNLPDFLAVVKSERERNKASPQFFTPEGCLKALQTSEPPANSNGKAGKPKWQADIEKCERCDDNGRIMEKDPVAGYKAIVCKHGKT
jgi:uncharacterized protein YdaU (DUF1376 family)